MMKPTIFAILLTTLCTTALAQTPPDLFQLSVKDAPAENGKKLEMNFKEIDREPESSTVEITFVSGGSVSSSMFVLRGMCGLAKTRGEKYFKSITVSKQPTRYLVSFLKSAEPSELRPTDNSNKVFSIAECELLKF